MKKNNIDILIKSLSKLTLKEILCLTDKLSKKFKIKNIENFSNNSNIEEKKNTKEEIKNVNIILQSVGNSSKLSLIRIIREITNIGLKEAKDITDKVPCVIANNINIDKYKEIEEKFNKIGAVIKIE
ncbi:LSU ribosomal protein L7/L12 (P1/P2) [Candidatus Vidania fulgoroideae]|uniref:LSU ribosomal protein L7/L12 (P1/P2) n=1 Tax=Candidatus Vidania fulgoroideorum TaxID=881286 RepID=A0A346E0A9_9PROT|nr:LSU ribosomal protein L7/L12 (P1/P2) [Candidatus Vidania fulgoroideae]WDI79360.1 ribosomal protein L7/L12 [Candidatus Vidania fulgoroideae]WDR79263.1 ribosomal protein L7/L12 [Candidatus Vidania fulgoroideae]